MLFRFQWHIDKLALGVRLGSGFISTSPLREFATIKKGLAKNLLEKETRQKISQSFCDHYILIPEIDKQTK